MTSRLTNVRANIITKKARLKSANVVCSPKSVKFLNEQVMASHPFAHKIKYSSMNESQLLYLKVN